MKENCDNITVVSGYWNVKNKYNHDNYNEWFENSLKINQRYIFFTNESENDFEKIKKYRNEDVYETYFIDYSLERFHSKQYASDDWINFHIPSKELGMIWNEKIHLLRFAKDIDVNPTEFYIWIDAGICVYRENKPPQKRFNLKDIDSFQLYR